MRESGVIGVVQIDQLADFIPFLFGAAFVGIFVLVSVSSIRQQKRAHANLVRVADELRLEVQSGTNRGPFGKGVPTLAGTIDGRPVRIYRYTTGSGKQRTQWCAITMSAPNPGGLSLHIWGENIFTKVGRTFGINDVQIGDPAFDKAFYVKSNKPEFIRAALLPEVRERFLAAHRAGARGTVTVEATEVKYAEVGTFADDKLVRRIPALVALVADVALITGASKT